MTDENLTPPNVPEMLRVTGENTAEFMKQVADHIQELENRVATLQARVIELESQLGDNNSAQ